MRAILVLLSVFFIQNQSFAQYIDDSPVIQAAIDVRNQFVNSLESKDFTVFARKGMEGAIQKLAEQLETDYQDQNLAQELIRQWEGSRGLIEFILNSKMAELGDHDPLFPWINEFLGKMSDKYGTIILTLPVVKNITMMNYAIPVVFRPHGTWQNDASSDGLDLRIEYRKHFIPFANLVTYYITLLGCEYAAQRMGQPQLKKVCKPVAEKLEFAMGRYIAPVVSDWIYNAGNQSLQIGKSRLKYNTVEDLRRAIQN